MIADRITGGPTTDEGFLGFCKTGNLIPKSATKGDRAVGLTNSTKGSPSFRIHPCAANPVSGSSHFSFFFLRLSRFLSFSLCLSPPTFAVTGWKTRFVDSGEVREDRLGRRCRLRLLDSVNYGLMEAKVPSINEVRKRQDEGAGTLWTRE